MRIVITGAMGMLGNDLINVLQDKHELYGIDIRQLTQDLGLNSYNLVDIIDAQEIYRVITKINPDLVIHAAAYTDVDGCESNKETAYTVNSLGTRNIALACQKFDTALMYISTDFVFDGESAIAYKEFDRPNPQSIYAKSKYWGEVFTQQLLSKFYIIRTSWLFGKNGKNFVSTIFNLAESRKELRVVDDQVGSPTYTKDLAGAIAHLILPSDGPVSVSQLYGIWHITNSGSCSWYEFAKKIVEPLGVNVKAITSQELKRLAKRPQFSVLDNYTWKLHKYKPLRSWQDALKAYSEEVKLYT